MAHRHSSDPRPNVIILAAPGLVVRFASMLWGAHKWLAIAETWHQHGTRAVRQQCHHHADCSSATIFNPAYLRTHAYMILLIIYLHRKMHPRNNITPLRQHVLIVAKLANRTDDCAISPVFVWLFGRLLFVFVVLCTSTSHLYARRTSRFTGGTPCRFPKR